VKLIYMIFFVEIFLGISKFFDFILKGLIKHLLMYIVIIKFIIFQLVNLFAIFILKLLNHIIFH